MTRTIISPLTLSLLCPLLALGCDVEDMADADLADSLTVTGDDTASDEASFNLHNAIAPSHYEVCGPWLDDPMTACTQCDIWLQDCPMGKCIPATDGWGTTECVPTGVKLPGEPCTIDPMIPDECDEGAFCQENDDGDDMSYSGTCIAYCQGTPTDPVCGPGTTCIPPLSDMPGAPQFGLCIPQCQEPASERGMYMWGEAILDAGNSATLVDDLLDFAELHAVNRIYFQAQGHISSESGRAKLESLVEEADARCIGIDLLFGDSSWHLPGSTSAQSLLTEANEFFAAIDPPTLPLRVHYDIEPHAHSSWGPLPPAKTQALSQLVTLYKSLMTMKGQLGDQLDIVVAMPRWYDTKEYAKTVPYNGVTRVMSQWVIDTVDGVMIMDYQDTASAMIIDAATEVAYASSLGTGRQVVIGVETGCGNLEAAITFCGEGSTAMEGALTAVSTHFNSSSAFAGVAIHDYDGWKNL